MTIARTEVFGKKTYCTDPKSFMKGKIEKLQIEFLGSLMSDVFIGQILSIKSTMPKNLTRYLFDLFGSPGLNYYIIEVVKYNLSTACVIFLFIYTTTEGDNRHLLIFGTLFVNFCNAYTVLRLFLQKSIFVTHYRFIVL